MSIHTIRCEINSLISKLESILNQLAEAELDVKHKANILYKGGRTIHQISEELDITIDEVLMYLN